MKRHLHIFALLTFVLSAKCTLAVVPEFKAPEIPSFSRYQGIINRMPFGAPPPDPGAMISPEDAKSAAQLQKEQQQLARKLNMSCVNITPSGTPAVGFSDLSQKPPVNYYLLVGASAGGWTLKSANYDEEWAELENDGVTIYVKLGQGLMAEPPVKKEVVATKTKSKSSKSHTGISVDGDEETDEEKPPPPPIEEQFVNLKATEMMGGPPAPGLTMVHMSSEDQKKRVEVLASALKEHDNTGKISSYTDRLLQKQIEKEKAVEAQNKAIRDELEDIAKEVAKATLEEQLKQAEEKGIFVDDLKLEE